MIIAFVFEPGEVFGGAKRRLPRIYNEICAENDDIKCDIVAFKSEINTVSAQLQLADCDVKKINHIYAFKSRIESLLHVLFLHKYTIIHFLMRVEIT